MEKAKDEIIRNHFTKYMETALDRARRDYIKRKQKLDGMEIVSEPEQLLSMQQGETDQEGMAAPDMIHGIPWEPGAVRLFLEEMVDDRMMAALSCLTDMELLVVFAKVFRQMTFKDIAGVMGWDPIKVASSYSYARKKMKKGWMRNGV